MGKKHRVLMLLMAAVMLFGCLCGCAKHKDPVDFDTACEKLEDEGLTVTVLDESMLGEGYKRGVAAEGSDFTVEFYEMEARENAIAMQKNVKEYLQDGQTISASTSVSGENYKFERFSVDDVYYIVSVIDDTVFLIYGDEANKDAIKDFAETFGYN